MDAGDVTALELAAERSSAIDEIHRLMTAGPSHDRIIRIRTIAHDGYGDYVLESARDTEPKRCAIRPETITILVDVDGAAPRTMALNADLAFPSTDAERHDTRTIRPLVTRRSMLAASDVYPALQAACPDPVGSPTRRAELENVATRAVEPQPRNPAHIAVAMLLDHDSTVREWTATAEAAADGPRTITSSAVHHGRNAAIAATAAMKKALNETVGKAHASLRQR